MNTLNKARKTEENWPSNKALSRGSRSYDWSKSTRWIWVKIWQIRKDQNFRNIFTINFWATNSVLTFVFIIGFIGVDHPWIDRVVFEVVNCFAIKIRIIPKDKQSSEAQRSVVLNPWSGPFSRNALPSGNYSWSGFIVTGLKFHLLVFL